ncbi:septum formation family protein [Streptomyces sp. NBC_00102]|uniref:septum formation family protein n=1 Tax=Streptomyces sp. NBC_00102 TaxID=2975652 RepID=UPI002253D575|nr:septum formation family protein [Streptomyces sp. NBC_00102]MCX5397720.1 septum formation family protein [Streptomyces sp. NBC_00102]
MSFGVKSLSVRGISAAVALLAIGASGCSVVDSAKEGIKKASREESVFSLGMGDCYNPNTKPAAEGDEMAEEFAVEVVPCAEPHDGQVFGEFKVDDGAYPGDDAIVEAADTRCPVEQLKFAPDAWALPAGVSSSYYQPTKESWATGDRLITCTFTKDSGKITGSLKSEAMNADQLAYLKGSSALYEAFWANMPEADAVEDDLNGYKALAAAVNAALGTHVAALQGIEQPETVKLREQLDKANAAWKKAANAGDADAFYLAYDPAITGIDPNATVAARKELGLSTTVPADEAAAWAS